MTRAHLPAVPVPDELFLAVEDDGTPATEPYDRGVQVEFAYSMPADRPANRGSAVLPVTRQLLERDESDKRRLVMVDAADGHGDGMPLSLPRHRGLGLTVLAPSAARAQEQSAAHGIWSAVVQRVSEPRSAWLLLEASENGASLNLVIDPDPLGWLARAERALGPRPHPPVTVVDSVESAPRSWRKAARALLSRG